MCPTRAPGDGAPRPVDEIRESDQGLRLPLSRPRLVCQPTGRDRHRQQRKLAVIQRVPVHGAAQRWGGQAGECCGSAGSDGRRGRRLRDARPQVQFVAETAVRLGTPAQLARGHSLAARLGSWAGKAQDRQKRIPPASWVNVLTCIGFVYCYL